MSILAIKDWRDYPDGKEKYNLYLASREWAVLKEAVKERSGGVCERCRNAPGQQVHHQTYARKYAEPLEDLVHTCAPCHEFLSGKRADDPVLKAPVRLMGRPIRRVYLAGKITGTRWRDEIVTEGWSFENHSAIDFDISEGKWSTIKNCLPIPDGRRLDMTGPFWRGTNLGGHSDIGYTAGPHAFTEVRDDEPHEGAAWPADLPALVNEIRSAIGWSDLLFAWIDSQDCFGTLVEIGFAAALSKVIVVAWPNGFDMSELWIARELSTVHRAGPSIQASGLTAKQAWDGLWSSPILTAAQPRSH